VRALRRTRRRRARGARRRAGAEIEACVAFDPDAWSDAEDPDGRIRAAARAAGQTRAPVFASFGRMPPARRDE
jgi:hypothetical protein